MDRPRSILNKICVRREEAEDITKGGIIIPETAKGKPTVGYVVSVGPEVDDTQLKVGDKIFFDQYVGTNFKLHDVEYVAMLMKDVLCVLEDDGIEEEITINIGSISDAHVTEDEGSM